MQRFPLKNFFKLDLVWQGIVAIVKIRLLYLLVALHFFISQYRIQGTFGAGIPI